MELIVLIIQIIIALGILNVWILRFGKASTWRGGSAKSMKEEFTVYGLPGWFMVLIGFLKISLAILLIAGIWFPALIKPAANVIAILMLGAIIMHIKVKDTLKKSLPAFIMLVLALIVGFV